MTGPETEEAVERLLRAYSAYYDVERRAEGDLVATARFHSRGERYFLTRGVNLWSVEDHEYVFVYAGDLLTPEALERAVQTSSETGMGLIKPGPDHRSSAITTILIYERMDSRCAKPIRRYREHRDFGFMLRGWMDHRVAALETSTSAIVSNRAGRDVAASLGTVAATVKRR